MATKNLFTEADSKQFAKNAENYCLIEGDREKIIKKVFPLKDIFYYNKKKKKFIYVLVNLPFIIADHFADMVIGDGIEIYTQNQQLQTDLNDIAEDNDLNTQIYEWAVSQAVYGYAVVRVRAENGKGVIEQIPIDQFIPVLSTDMIPKMIGAKIVSFLTIEDKGKKDDYWFIENYTQADDTTYLQYELWRGNSEGQLKESVPLSIYDATLPTDPINLETKVFPIFKINNTKFNEKYYSKSDFEPIKPQLQEINDRVSQMSLQFIKHFNAKIALPLNIINDQGEVNGADFETIQVPQGGIIPQYITQNNPMVEEALKNIEMNLRQISAITKIPAEVLGLDTSVGEVRVEAIKLRNYPTTRKTKRKQMYFEKQLVKILERCLEIAGKPTEDQINIEWTNPLPQDRVALIDEVIKRKDASLLSSETALKMLDGEDPEQNNLELQRIKAEQPKPINFGQMQPSANINFGGSNENNQA